MNENDLLTLLLISSGDYHATRCSRADNGLSVEHFDKSVERLMTDDLVEIVGDEMVVSAFGRHTIDDIIYR